MSTTQTFDVNTEVNTLFTGSYAGSPKIALVLAAQLFLHHVNDRRIVNVTAEYEDGSGYKFCIHYEAVCSKHTFYLVDYVEFSKELKMITRTNIQRQFKVN